jgi:hypothetical protein
MRSEADMAPVAADPVQIGACKVGHLARSALARATVVSLLRIEPLIPAGLTWPAMSIVRRQSGVILIFAIVAGVGFAL